MQVKWFDAEGKAMLVQIDPFQRAEDNRAKHLAAGGIYGPADYVALRLSEVGNWLNWYACGSGR